MAQCIAQVFELDVLILHTEDDRLEAFKFKEHLIKDTGVVGLAVQLYDEFQLDKSQLAAFDNVFNKTRFVFVFMTKSMEQDVLQKFIIEMSLLESFNDGRTRYRILPVWTTRERLDVPIMNQYPGLRYWQYTDGIIDIQKLYLKGLNRMLTNGKETITLI